MKVLLRNPVGSTDDNGSGPDGVNSGLMDSWGDGQNPTQGGQQTPATPPPPPRQVTPPHRPAQRVIRDDTDANRMPARDDNTGQFQSPDQGQQQAQTPATHQLSEADLQRIATVAGGAAARAVQPAQTQQQQSPAMSDEDFAKRYRTPRVDAAVMAAIHDPDPAKGAAALQDILRQTYTSALLMSNDLHQAELAKVRGEFAPHIATIQQQQAAQRKTALENQFYAAHADLTDERELVNEIIDSFQAKVARGEVRFANEQEAFKAVADNARKLLSRMGAGGAGQQTSSQQQHSAPPPPQQRRMTTATSQGRGGTGQAATGSAMDKMFASWDRNDN